MFFVTDFVCILLANFENHFYQMRFMPIKNIYIYIYICFHVGPKVESNMRILSPDSHQMTMDRGSVYRSHTRKTSKPICLPKLCDIKSGQ